MSTRLAVPVALVCAALGAAYAQEPRGDLGLLSANPHRPNSTGGSNGPPANPYNRISVNNPGSKYGSPHSNQSATNPFATEAPRLYDSNGKYRGRLSANRYDPDSISNPFGRYGSRFSPDSINNHCGVVNPHDLDSPGNPYGNGLIIAPGDVAAESTQRESNLNVSTRAGQFPADSPSQELQLQQPQPSSDSANAIGESNIGEAAK